MLHFPWATNILNFMQPPLFVTPLRLEPCVCVYVQLGTFCIIFLISRWNMTKDTHTHKLLGKMFTSHLIANAHIKKLFVNLVENSMSLRRHLSWGQQLVNCVHNKGSCSNTGERAIHIWYSNTCCT